MAIAYDAAGSNFIYVGSSATATLTLAASSSNSIAVIFCTNGNGAPLTGVTVNGNPATLIYSDNFDGSVYCSSFYYVNPPTTPVDYVATATNATDDVEIAVFMYSGAKQTGQPDSIVNGNAAVSLTLSTTTSADNCWLVSASRNGASGPATAGTGTTKRFPTSGSALASYGDSNGPKTPAGSHSMQWLGTSVFAMMVSISPSTGGGSGPANVKTYNSIASANVKTINSIAIASVKTWNSIT